MTQSLVSYTDQPLAFVMSVEQAKTQLAELQEFVKSVMVEDEDYGVIPGTQKPTLLKPGAEKLCEIYGLAQHIEVTTRIEDWEKGFFHYEVKATLTSKRTGGLVSEGIGSCNTKEASFRWRNAQRVCPHCGQETIIKGKDEYGGGWLCWKSKGGCGAKFADGAGSIENQVQGRVENDDPYTLVNNVLKRAKKRAVVDATLSATRSSSLFTQDVEDMGVAEEPPARPQRPTAAKKTTLEGTARPVHSAEPTSDAAHAVGIPQEEAPQGFIFTDDLPFDTPTEDDELMQITAILTMYKDATTLNEVNMATAAAKKIEHPTPGQQVTLRVALKEAVDRLNNRQEGARDGKD